MRFLSFAIWIDAIGWLLLLLLYGSLIGYKHPWYKSAGGVAVAGVAGEDFVAEAGGVDV